MTWLLPLNLPSLLPGETLYSWNGFVHARNGIPDSRETSRRLTGSSSSALLHDFPARLAHLDEALEGALGPIRELALRHTLLGYFLPAIPSGDSEEILGRTLHGTYSDIKFKLGLPASKVGCYHPLKACFACIEEDERTHGRAYWHVEHQLPSVLVCTTHGVTLTFVDDAITPVHRRGWILPTLGLDGTRAELPHVDSVQMSRLVKLAKHSAVWATLEPGALDRRRLALTYQAAFRQRGWATASGSLRLPALVKEVQSHFRGLEVLPGLAILKSIHAEWPGLIGNLARTVPRRAHPLKHLILLSMLFDRWSDFLDHYASTSTSSAPVPSEDTTRVLRAESMSELGRLVREDGVSVTAAAKQLGISTTTGTRWAKVLGLPFTARTKHLTDETKEPVRELLRVGQEKTAICRTTGISATSLNRLISEEPAVGNAWRTARAAAARTLNRARLQAVARQHPGWTLKQLRTLPNNGYAWLYRNDRRWLLENIPSLWQAPSQQPLPSSSDAEFPG